MNVKFSKDELAMVYQYAAATKQETLAGLLSVDKDLWKTEAEGIREFYKKFGEKLPAELMAELEKLEKNLE